MAVLQNYSNCCRLLLMQLLLPLASTARGIACPKRTVATTVCSRILVLEGAGQAAYHGRKADLPARTSTLKPPLQHETLKTGASAKYRAGLMPMANPWEDSSIGTSCGGVDKIGTGLWLETGSGLT